MQPSLSRCAIAMAFAATLAGCEFYRYEDNPPPGGVSTAACGSYASGAYKCSGSGFPEGYDQCINGGWSFRGSCRCALDGRESFCFEYAEGIDCVVLGVGSCFSCKNGASCG